MDTWYDVPAGHVLTPVDRLDSDVANLIQAAQTEAQRRWHYAALSDLILLAAVSGSGSIANTLLKGVGTDRESFRDAVDAEWAKQLRVEDEPRDAIRQAIFASVALIPPKELVGIPLFLAELLRLEGSRASRVVRGLGGVPEDLAKQLERTEST